MTIINFIVNVFINSNSSYWLTCWADDAMPRNATPSVTLSYLLARGYQGTYNGKRASSRMQFSWCPAGRIDTSSEPLTLVIQKQFRWTQSLYSSCSLTGMTVWCWLATLYGSAAIPPLSPSVGFSRDGASHTWIESRLFLIHVYMCLRSVVSGGFK